MIKIELIDIYPTFSEISPELDPLVFILHNSLNENKQIEENLIITNENIKDDNNNILNISFPFDYNPNNKKEEKLKIKLVKKEFTNVIGTGEISLTSYTNLKQKKTQVSKKWYNISSSQPSQSQKESNSSLTKRGINSANLALNLINTIKVHLKITETFTDNTSLVALSSPNTNATEAEDFNSKSTKENFHLSGNYNNNNFKHSNSNNSNKSSGITHNNSLNVNSVNNLSNKLKSEFEELKDVKDLFDYKSNVAINNNNSNSKSGLNGNVSISNNNTKTNINLNLNSNKGSETPNNSNGKQLNNINNKEILNSTNCFNNFKEKSAILSKSNNNSTQSNSKKAKLDVSLSQSLNSSNFLVIKNSLNNSIIGAKGEEKKTSNFANSNKTQNEKERKETKDNKEKSVSNNNYQKGASQSISNSNNLKKKNVSMIETNLNATVKTLRQQQSTLNESPQNKANVASGKAKETNLNTVRSTTNKNSVKINYNDLSNTTDTRTKNLIRSLPDNKRNLSTTRLLNNTTLNKEATTPKLSFNKFKKEKEDVSFIAEDNDNCNNNNKKLNDSHVTNSFIDELFMDDNMEYLNDPLAENNFKSCMDEFKAVYNEAYISILPEEESFLGMEHKMLIDKFTEIQTSYHKNLIKFSNDNLKLNEFLHRYTEKYSLIDKKLKRLDHLLKEEKIKNSLINADKLKKQIFNETSKTNKIEFQLMNSIFSGKVSQNYQKELDSNNKKNELNGYLKANLFQVIKGILNNPKNKNKINENIFDAFKYLEENYADKNSFNKNAVKSLYNPLCQNNDVDDNNKENYYSPHFSKQDQLIDNSNYSSVNNNNDNVLLHDNILNSNQGNNLNSNNNAYESNYRVNDNVITLNDINSANVSPETNKNYASIASDKNIKEEDMQQDTEKSSQTNKDPDSKEKQNMYRALLEKKLKHIYSHKPNMPKIEFRNLSGASLFYGTIKLKLVLEPSSPDNLKVTWKKLNNYVTTSLEEFLDFNASQQESKIHKVSEQTNTKNPVSNVSSKNAVTARGSKLNNHLSKSPIPTKKKFDHK